MPEFRDREVIETFAKGSPARNMDLMSPLDRKGEVYAERRRTSRDPYAVPRRRSPAYYSDDDYDDTHNRQVVRPRNPSSARRHSRHHRDDRLVRHHRYDSSSGSDSNDSSLSSTSRRKPKMRPCSSVCRDDPKFPKTDLADDEPYDSANELKERAKRRKNTLLTAGLASVATVAAGNNIYQNTKAYHARKTAMRDGEMCTHEFEKLKTKGNLMNLFSLGVVAVGLNNVRMGWMRHENTKRENKAAERRAWERKIRRDEERERESGGRERRR